MIIGDINECGCKHDIIKAINHIYGFCFDCLQMVLLTAPSVALPKDLVTRELPRPRQDPPINVEERIQGLSSKESCP